MGRDRDKISLKSFTLGPVTEGGDQAVVRIIITLADHCRPLLVVTGETAGVCDHGSDPSWPLQCTRLAAAYIKAGPNQGPGTRQRGRAVHRGHWAIMS